MQLVHHNWYSHKKDLQNIKTKLPSYEEQQKIGDFFSEIDRLVEKQSSKVGRLKVRKKRTITKNVCLIQITAY
ncbi:restriction endonuclease subunit S [Staphylococcus aureus]|nr:restriction endonuclease subunit S [Staphylococcus aureus]